MILNNSRLEIIRKITVVKPNIKFSSDFIIGYPGETLDDFDQTIKILKKVEFINSFSFTFSPRPGTPAFNLEQIDQNEAKTRLIKFQKIAEKIKNDYRKKLINKTVKVLFENKMKNTNKYFGRDEYFNSVIVESNKELSGQIKNVNILEGNQNTLFGEITSSFNQNNYAA